jgi:hypothetical protein
MEDPYAASLGAGDDDLSGHGPEDVAQPPSQPSSLSHPSFQSPNDAASMDPSLDDGDDLAVPNGSEHGPHPVLGGNGGDASQGLRRDKPLAEQQQQQQQQRYAAGRVYADDPATAQWRTPTLTFDAAEPPPRRASQDSANPAAAAAATTTAAAAALQKRALPPRDVTEDTIEDAYVAFILYCNPNVPVPADLSDLRRGFRNPPKSDGKSFSTYTLFELIRKLENKVIKSWSQLALLLGVEPPNAEKRQSTQKVQQYAVRLKVWRFICFWLCTRHTRLLPVPHLRDPSFC